jgi:adenosine deaminase
MSWISLELLQALPKAELHCHLDGSMRPTTLLELAQAHSVPIPGFGPVPADALDPAHPDHGPALQAMNRACHVGEVCEGLEDYLKAFEFTVACMADAEALERIAYELAMDHHAEGVDWLEVRFGPALMQQHGLSLDEAVAAIARGLDRAKDHCGIASGQILCGLRHLPLETIVETAHLAAHCYGAGKHRVVGFDLAADESSHEVSAFADALELCADKGVPVTLHAGEARGAEAVGHSVEHGADRIGHGTRLPEDMELLHELAWEQVPLEVCLTSNLQTRTIRTIADHPLRLFLEKDLPFVLCTDNRYMSDITLPTELKLAIDTFDLGPRQLYRILMSGFLFSFAPEVLAERLVEAADRRLTELLGD